jgi:enamine deaminase RidA (YjgF/YER057c/UK114 family)
LEAHLKTAGATLDDVVELQSFHVAKDHAEFRARIEPVLKVHREFFKDRYPAWTAVGTTALFSPGAPMELRAEAIIGSGARAKVAIPAPASK